MAAGLGDLPGPLAGLRLALLLMAPLAVFFSSIGGYWLAGRALAPVDEVTRMAQEIGASSLSRRLPVTNAHDEVARPVDTFNQMIARLEGSFESMKRFTVDASHELRGPLTTMRGAIDVALSKPREAGDYKQALVSVGEDVNRLRSIAEDLLVLSESRRRPRGARAFSGATRRCGRGSRGLVPAPRLRASHVSGHPM